MLLPKSEQIEEIKNSFENCIARFGHKKALVLITEALKDAEIRATSEAGETCLSVDSSVHSFVKSEQALEKSGKPVSINGI